MRWLHWNAGSSHLQGRRLEMLPRQTSTPGDGWLEASTHNVRFGSEADMCSARADVRFTPNSDIDSVFRHVCFGPIADMIAAASSPIPRRIDPKTSTFWVLTLQ